MLTLAVDDQNKNLAMARAQAAQAQGLDPAVYGATFPGANVNITLPPDPPAPAPSTMGTIGKLALGAGILATGGSVGALAVKAFTPSAVPPAPAPIIAPATPQIKPYLFDEVEQIKQPDGTWKDTGKTTRKRMNADGTVTKVDQ